MTQDSTKQSDRRWYQQLPPKLAAIVVFLVALTTLLGNLLELNQKRQLAPALPAAPPTASSAKPAPVSVLPTQPMPPRRMLLRLDRIAVEHDGSPGTTDWRFTILADGQPLFAFQQNSLDDAGGRNISMPEHAQSTLRLKPGQPIVLQVQAWRLSRLRAAQTPDAIGNGQLSAGGELAPIKVAAKNPESGAFVFYFSADAQ